jgi:hypothetical protein
MNLAQLGFRYKVGTVVGGYESLINGNTENCSKKRSTLFRVVTQRMLICLTTFRDSLSAPSSRQWPLDCLALEVRADGLS